MTVIVNSGRVTLAAALKEHHAANPYSVFMAFGAGEDWWGSPQNEVIAFGADDLLVTTYPDEMAAVPENPDMRVSTLVVTSEDETTTYIAGTDYSASSATGTVTRIPTGSIPAEGTVRLRYTAKVPEPSLDETALVSEIGRVRILALDHVLPEEEAQEPGATVVVERQTYVFQSSPTRMLLVRAGLEPHMAVGPAIREYGIVTNGAVDPALPPGQLYYSGADITNPGHLFSLRRRTPVPRDGTLDFYGTQIIAT